ncbi:MAG: FHA domain-containing protein [candidate division Zixibacteria bacterium]|nr:FHA domain-containing protein [candidate division Zixibacteria bacterium]
MPEIIVKFEEKIIEKFITEKRRVTVGRTPDNDIVLENRAISRRHAIIEFSEDQTIIMDNESLNGTFVNSRKINEEVLKNDDIITIGKYSLVYHKEEERDSNVFGMDGTMVLQTKKQKEMIAKDKKAKELTSEAGCSILLGEVGAEQDKYPLAHSVVTIGRSKMANIKAKGWLLSGVQAKVVKNGEDFWIVNLGRKGKSKVNGEPIENSLLRNDDIIQVGKTVFRFIENKAR